MILLLTCENPATRAGLLVLGCALGARCQPVRRERPIHARILMAHLTRPGLPGPVVDPHLIHKDTAGELCSHLLARFPRPVGDLPHLLLISGEHIHVEQHPAFTLDGAPADTAGQPHHRTLLELVLQALPGGEGSDHPHPIKVLSQPPAYRGHQIRWVHTSAAFLSTVNACQASSSSTSARTCASGRRSLSRSDKATCASSASPYATAAALALDAMVSASARMGPVTSSERITSPMPS